MMHRELTWCNSNTATVWKGTTYDTVTLKIEPRNQSRCFDIFEMNYITVFLIKWFLKTYTVFFAYAHCMTVLCTESMPRNFRHIRIEPTLKSAVSTILDREKFWYGYPVLKYGSSKNCIPVKSPTPHPKYPFVDIRMANVRNVNRKLVSCSHRMIHWLYVTIMTAIFFWCNNW